MNGDLPLVSVVIPSYNRRQCMLRLLRDVLAQEGVPFEIIVVDDCSSDGSVEAIKCEFPSVRLLASTSNGGPCVARNRGVLAARGEIAIGLDSDVGVPDKGLFRKVAEILTMDKTITGLAFRILGANGDSDDVGRWWHPAPIHRFSTRVFCTSYFSGTAYAFRREAVIEAGMFPEVFYMYSEEVELALRIIDRGGKIQYRPELSVTHYVDPTPRRTRVQTFFKPRNQVLLAFKCMPLISALLYLSPRLFINCLHAFAGGHLGACFAAYRSAVEVITQRRCERDPVRSATLRGIRQLRIQTGACSY